MKTIGRRRREDDGTLIEGRAGTRFWKLLRAGRTVDKVFVAEGARIGDVAAEARRLRRAGRHLRPPQARPYMSPTGNHQGVIAQAAAQEYVSLDHIFRVAEERGEAPLIGSATVLRTHDNLARSSARRNRGRNTGHYPQAPRGWSSTAAVARARRARWPMCGVHKANNLSGGADELEGAGCGWRVGRMERWGFLPAAFDRPCAIVIGSEGQGLSSADGDK